MADHATRVLIVEDIRINRLVIQQMLKRIPELTFATVEAESGPEAMDKLRAEAFDIVLMDVQMPGMDGLETSRAIRAGQAGDENRDIPIVAMTAHVGSDEEQACFDAGMTAYLAKPLRLQKLADVLRDALGR